MKDTDAIMKVLPRRLQELLASEGIRLSDYEELRIRSNQPVTLKKGRNQVSLNLVLSHEEMERILLGASSFSVYAVEEQLSEGYLTLQGGHRLGIAGEILERNGRIEGIRCIQAYNFRIAHEIIGCAEALYPLLWEQGEFLDTLILSPPGVGKTTLLRDMIRLLSDGTKLHPPLTVGLADERGEIAACVNGIAQNNIGAHTDVMDKGVKQKTMRMLLRTMSPEVLATDEAGGPEESRLFVQAKGWGVHILSTLHGTMADTSLEDNGLTGVFQRYVEIFQNPDRQYHVYDRNRQRIAVVPAEDSNGFMQKIR